MSTRRLENVQDIFWTFAVGLNLHPVSKGFLLI